ncbi:response regulator transcription factor [Ferrimicrobium sp.]|uniref:response regulator transcription factor n=1 Tax=Ferrimicrobium sp. TaxID=2926050 RepID=UPI0026144FE8|nr:response regulator transcription factor [Ferrimicrobium sp.]
MSTNPKQSTSIVFAEDDRATRDSTRLALELEGYHVITAASGQEALLAITEHRPELIILDLMMPSVDGLRVCRQLRSVGDKTPILLLTARTQIADRVVGLDAGADDYLTKPFALDELFARVRALLRRSSYGSDGEWIVLGDLRIDERGRRAFRNDRELILSKTEFDLLQLLAFNAGTVLEHGLIYDRIWGYDFGPDSKNLAVYIGYLRKKLELPGEEKLLRTVRGVGYVLIRP